MSRDSDDKQKDSRNYYAAGGGSGAVYGMGVIGAAIYFVSVASGFWAIVLGILKALVWPAFVVYELLKFLQLS